MSVCYWHCGVCGTAQHSGLEGCIFCGTSLQRGGDVPPEPVRHITRRDYGVLDTLLAKLPASHAARAPLLARLAAASVVPDDDRSLVSLETKVRFCVDGAAPVIRLLTAGPAERPGLLSVLTPLGLALLGCSAGVRAAYQDRQDRCHEVTIEEVVAPPRMATGAVCDVIRLRPRPDRNPPTGAARRKDHDRPDGAA